MGFNNLSFIRRVAAPSQILAVPSQDKTILLHSSATIPMTAASKNSPEKEVAANHLLPTLGRFDYE